MASRARRHALSVLGSGQVEVTLSDQGSLFRVRRTAADAQPQTDELLPDITILAQNEIERVGIQDSGRLRLLDGFLAARGLIPQWGKLLAQVRTLTAEVRSINDELDQVQDQMRSSAKVGSELTAARQEEARVLKTTSASTAEQRDLKAYQSKAARAALQSSVVGRTRQRLEEWAQRVADLSMSVPTIEAWPEGAGEADLLTRARSALPEIVEQLEAVQVSLGGIADELRASEETSRAERAEADEKAREIRIRLEKMQEGAGAITRRVQALQERPTNGCASLAEASENESLEAGDDGARRSVGSG